MKETEGDIERKSERERERERGRVRDRERKKIAIIKKREREIIWHCNIDNLQNLLLYRTDGFR